jgi:predicted negative regulator of RcsB-dependent stress response
MSSFLHFLGENKIWWILPIVIVLALVGFMVWSEQNVETPNESSPFQYDMY